MKKTAAALFCFAAISALAIAAQTQDVFDLLRKGDVPAVKAMVEKSPQLVEARDGNGNERHKKDAKLFFHVRLRCQFVILPPVKTNFWPIVIGTWMARPGNLAWKVF